VYERTHRPAACASFFRRDRADVQALLKDRAAAVTEVLVHTKSVIDVPPRIRHIAFDRPFGLVVFAGGSGVPLFTGWQASAPRSV
jgi:hypothetical protein